MNTTGAHTGIFVSHKLDACFRCTLHNAHFRKTLPEMSNSYCHPGKAGGLPSIFNMVSNDPSFEFARIDGTISKAHRHGQGAKGGLKISRPEKAGAA
jgi:hypothetical protein